MFARSPLRQTASYNPLWPRGRVVRRGRAARRFVPAAPVTLEKRLALSSDGVLSAQSALAGLAQVMDRDFSRFPVYDDVGSPGNHFFAWAKIGDDLNAVKISGASTANPHSGATAIRAELDADPNGKNFGGFYFLNGVLPSGETTPQVNFGTVPNAGVDLSGATALTFWARGASGGETVDFFMGGVGRDPVTGNPLPGTPYPDSTPVAKITVKLTTGWHQYLIDLSGLDLHYVLGGFGWDASAQANPGGVVFFLDDIQYELGPAAQAQRLNAPRLLRSYETLPLQPDPFDANTSDDIDFVLRNTAFTYDNALAVLAFLADPTGNPDSLRRASLIGDALVYDSNHDRTYTDGRLRSAYAADDVSVAPGWTPNNRVGTAPVPGFYVEATDGSGTGKFYEVQDSSSKSDVGDNAWAMIALLALYRRTGKAAYLDTARRLGAFIEQFRNTTGLYPGFQGGLDNPETPSPTRRPWSSTEHNLDVAAAFTVMAQVTGEPQWRQDASLAASFVESMYDPAHGDYLAGTTDPDHRNTDPLQLPLDVQAWRALALPGFQGRVAQALAGAEANQRVTAGGFTGFDFNNDKDGVWFEGTGQMAVAYAFTGREPDAAFYRAELRRAQAPPAPPAGTGNGSLVAATANPQLTTGFGFTYYRRLHVGATAWEVFAQLGYNPYYQIDAKTPGDYDGDGKADLGYYTPSAGLFVAALSGGGKPIILTGFGGPGWQATDGDYDGDGKVDVGLYSDGAFVVVPSGNPGHPIVIRNFGSPDSQPLSGDYDGDGKTDFGYYTPSAGLFVVAPSGGGKPIILQNFGGPGWQATDGDYDGDGKTDVGLYGFGTFVVVPSRGGAPIVIRNFGAAGSQPLSGDYDGDGKADFGYYTPSAGLFVAALSGGGKPIILQNFGGPGWQATAADYDGDGRVDIGLHYGGGAFAVIPSRGGAPIVIRNFGAAGSQPLGVPPAPGGSVSAKAILRAESLPSQEPSPTQTTTGGAGPLNLSQRAQVPAVVVKTPGHAGQRRSNLSGAQAPNPLAVTRVRRIGFRGKVVWRNVSGSSRLSGVVFRQPGSDLNATM